MYDRYLDHYNYYRHHHYCHPYDRRDWFHYHNRRRWCNNYYPRDWYYDWD